MKIERINENKIKVLLDADEASQWNVSSKNLGSGTPEVTDMFWAAIRKAQEDVDFFVDGAKLFVEPVPDPTFPLVMMITKVVNDEELNAAINKCGLKGKIKCRDLHLPRPIKNNNESHIYKFRNFEDLCTATKEIFSKNIGKSNLYKCADAFYLELFPEEKSSFFTIENILIEFAERIQSAIAMGGWLNEHGVKMINESAIDVINSYF